MKILKVTGKKNARVWKTLRMHFPNSISTK